MYSARIVPPSIAYLGQNTFGEEFLENDLISDWMFASMCEIIYVGPFGATEAISPQFVCQATLCARRQMMRYVRGFEAVYSAGI